MAEIPTIQLHNGVNIPQLGLGVWQAEDGAEVKGAVLSALEAGYRLIDTAAIYGNETGVGEAIRESGLPREEVFITTKLWNSDQGQDSVIPAFEASMQKLGLDYLDLYLIHWPSPGRGLFVETWQKLVELYQAKRIRAIGVSNFTEAHLQEVIDKSDVIPMVNQVELHPFLTQQPLRQFCDTYGIKVESYSPLMQGGEVLQHATIHEIAEHHGKTPAQVVLRWHIDNGLIVIPKSVTPERIRENIDIFDFSLSREELALIDDLNQDRRIGGDPNNFSG